MHSPLFLKDFEERLKHHPCISRRYTQRVIAELEDHFHELEEERVKSGCDREQAAQLAQEQLIRDPDALFAEIVRQQGTTGFITRCGGTIMTLAREHALSAFGLGPILAFLAAYFGCMIVGVAVYSVLVDGLHISNMNPLLRYAVDKTFTCVVYTATPLMALGFCRLAARANRSILLALTACILLSILGGMMKLDLVQCTAGRDVAYFRRFGPDLPRLLLPLLVFAAYTALHQFRNARAHPST